MDSQRGAVLANELKNNSFKLAKWTAQSLLSGADQMKIGFCSRSAPKNAYEHVILATQFYRPKDFATQITLAEGQMWAMMRMFVQMFSKQPEGKEMFLLVIVIIRRIVCIILNIPSVVIIITIICCCR